MNADGAGVVHYLARSAHKSSSKVQQYVCRGQQQQQQQQRTAGITNVTAQVLLTKLLLHDNHTAMNNI